GGGRVRHTVVQDPYASLRLRELRFERLQPFLRRLQLLQLLGRRLALELPPRADLLDLRLELALRGVRGEQLVEDVGRALPRERRAVGVGLGACSPQVDHGFESRSASSTCATPSSAAGGQTQRATAFTRSCAFATAMP